jgi:phage/plasmid-like protein (TIGR03299 family)
MMGYHPNEREQGIMSQETAQWLNTMTLIGYTAKRGNAWHYRAADQGAEPNHYVGAIPVEDVKRRLFSWAHAEGSVTSEYLGADGFEVVSDPTRKAILRPRGTFSADDPGAILGVFKTGYKVHPFGEWLVDNVGTILDADVQIGSAGLLKGGARAWVQVELADTISTAEGVDFRPFLTASTTVDGSGSTKYGTGSQVAVCDNTLVLAEGQASRAGTQVKIKHSANSLGRLADVRDVLGVIHAEAEAFQAEVTRLTQETVSPADWRAFLKVIAPMPADDATGRGAESARTIADRKRGELNMLWTSDLRVSPWAGTAFGVVQAVNTQVHHLGNVRGQSRVERNMTKTVSGGADGWGALTVETLAALGKARQLATV